jgi:hypothetical protein
VTGGHTTEIKFVVAAGIGLDIAAWVREHLIADEHGGGPHRDEYRVTSLYFDTAAADVFHRRGSYGRSKYRIRRYQDERAVFLERKLRTATLLAKRRTRVDVELLPLLAARELKEWDAARWFERRIQLRALRPVCQVSYVRIARQIETPAGLARLTLDACVAAVANPTWGFMDVEGTALTGGKMILEIKYRSHAPAVFRRLVQEFQLNPQPASKYRLAVNALGFAGTHA